MQEFAFWCILLVAIFLWSLGSDKSEARLEMACYAALQKQLQYPVPSMALGLSTEKLRDEVDGYTRFVTTINFAEEIDKRTLRPGQAHCYLDSRSGKIKDGDLVRMRLVR